MKSAGVKTQRRRRKENKTNYSKRLKLLKGQVPRLVFRKTNRYIIAEYITSKEAQDKVELTVNSKALLMNGWPKEDAGSLKSVTASYLTGYLIGKKITKGKMEKPILDLGMTKIIHGNKAFAFLKGVIDSGIKIHSDEKVFPSKDRIEGKNLKKDFSKTFHEIKSKIDKQ